MQCPVFQGAQRGVIQVGLDDVHVVQHQVLLLFQLVLAGHGCAHGVAGLERRDRGGLVAIGIQIQRLCGGAVAPAVGDGLDGVFKCGPQLCGQAAVAGLGFQGIGCVDIAIRHILAAPPGCRGNVVAGIRSGLVGHPVPAHAGEPHHLIGIVVLALRISRVVLELRVISEETRRSAAVVHHAVGKTGKSVMYIHSRSKVAGGRVVGGVDNRVIVTPVRAHSAVAGAVACRALDGELIVAGRSVLRVDGVDGAFHHGGRAVEIQLVGGIAILLAGERLGQLAAFGQRQPQLHSTGIILAEVQVDTIRGVDAHGLAIKCDGFLGRLRGIGAARIVQHSDSVRTVGGNCQSIRRSCSGILPSENREAVVHRGVARQIVDKFAAQQGSQFLQLVFGLDGGRAGNAGCAALCHIVGQIAGLVDVFQRRAALRIRHDGRTGTSAARGHGAVLISVGNGQRLHAVADQASHIRTTGNADVTHVVYIYKSRRVAYATHQTADHGCLTAGLGGHDARIEAVFQLQRMLRLTDQAAGKATKAVDFLDGGAVGALDHAQLRSNPGALVGTDDAAGTLLALHGHTGFGVAVFKHAAAIAGNTTGIASGSHEATVRDGQVFDDRGRIAQGSVAKQARLIGTGLVDIQSTDGVALPVKSTIVLVFAAADGRPRLALIQRDVRRQNGAGSGRTAVDLVAEGFQVIRCGNLVRVRRRAVALIQRLRTDVQRHRGGRLCGRHRVEMILRSAVIRFQLLAVQRDGIFLRAGVVQHIQPHQCAAVRAETLTVLQVDHLIRRVASQANHGGPGGVSREGRGA